MNRIDGIVVVDRDGLEFLSRTGINVNGRIVFVDENSRCTPIELLMIVQDIEGPIEELIIGIDFGKHIGIAVIAKDKVVYVENVHNWVKALEILDMFLECIRANRYTIRLGLPRKDEREYELLIERIVKVYGEKAIIELVPESGSSRNTSFLRSKRKLEDDEIAAINIALRRSS